MFTRESLKKQYEEALRLVEAFRKMGNGLAAEAAMREVRLLGRLIWNLDNTNGLDG